MSHQGFLTQYGRLASISGACGLVLAAVGYLPTVRLGGETGATGMIYGICVSLVAGLVGAIPVARALSHSDTNVPIAVLLGTALRFLVVLMMVAALVFSGFVDRVAFVTWVGISYLLLLLVDTLASLAWLKSAPAVRIRSGETDPVLPDRPGAESPPRSGSAQGGNR